jgi:uncharacterized linocin/CFP29 family protein
MSYLSRAESPIPAELWDQIDNAVVSTAKKTLVGRRFLHIFGPLGIGAESIHIDDVDSVTEVYEDGLMVTKGRKFVEIPTLYDDFTLLAKDLEYSAKYGYPIDMAKAMASAEALSMKEDRLIFFGSKAHGYEGLLNASGTNKIKKSDWREGENAFTDVAAAIERLVSQGVLGAYSLILSPDLYMQLQRIQPGTGLLEIDRASKLVDGRVYRAPVLGSGKAVLVCGEPRNMDLVIGQDMAAAYLEQVDLNHTFRLLETVLLRIKRRQAIVVFE